MIISSEFRMGQYRDDDHREDAPHFILGFLKVNYEYGLLNIFQPGDYAHSYAQL